MHQAKQGRVLRPHKQNKIRTVLPMNTLVLISRSLVTPTGVVTITASPGEKDIYIMLYMLINRLKPCTMTIFTFILNLLLAERLIDLYQVLLMSIQSHSIHLKICKSAMFYLFHICANKTDARQNGLSQSMRSEDEERGRERRRRSTDEYWSRSDRERRGHHRGPRVHFSDEEDSGRGYEVQETRNPVHHFLQPIEQTSYGTTKNLSITGIGHVPTIALVVAGYPLGHVSLLTIRFMSLEVGVLCGYTRHC